MSPDLRASSCIYARVSLSVAARERLGNVDLLEGQQSLVLGIEAPVMLEDKVNEFFAVDQPEVRLLARKRTRLS